jgi:plasmid stabilization system protein ParE
MPHVIISLNASSNIRRIRRFYGEPAIGDKAVAAINAALRLLITNPKVGRPTKNRIGLRERIIAFGNQGFIALYRIDEAADEVTILAIRHQREAGYRDSVTPLEH